MCVYFYIYVYYIYNAHDLAGGRALRRNVGPYLVNEHMMYMKEKMCITGHFLNVFHEYVHQRIHDLRTHVCMPDVDVPTAQRCSYFIEYMILRILLLLNY